MWLLDFIKQLFKKQKQTKAIISNSKKYSRTDFDEDTYALEQIEYYKNIFSEILNTSKSIVSKELNFDSFFEDMQAYLNIILNNYLEDDSLNNIFNKQTLTKEEQKNLLIIIRKLEVYFKNISNLEYDAKLRLIALSEIYDEEIKKIYKRRNKMYTLICAMDTLNNTLTVFNSSKVGVAYKIKTFVEATANYFDKQVDEFEKYCNFNSMADKALEIEKLLQLIGDESIINDKKSIKWLADAEVKLEVYVYKHKEEAKELILKIEELYFTEVNENNRDDLLKEVIEIEQQYLFFYKYGRNLIKEEDFNLLYELKFKLLTFGSEMIEPFVNNETNELELKCYEKIIIEIYQEIITGKNIFFNKTFAKSLEDAINIFSNTMKINYKFRPSLILKDELLLNIIMSFKEERSLQSVFNMIKDDRIKHSLYGPSPINYYEHALKWEYEIPLDSQYRMMMLNEDKYNIMDDSPYYLYKLMIDNEEESPIYFLPEGIIEMNLSFLSHSEYDTNLLETFSNKIKNKIVVMPYSLKRVSFSRIRIIKSLVLNEGLEIIDNHAFSLCNLNEVTIPSTVREISPTAFMWEKLETIKFELGDSNPLLENYEQFKNIFKNTVFAEVKSIHAAYVEDFLVVRLKTNVKKIILLSNDNNEIVIESRKFARESFKNFNRMIESYKEGDILSEINDEYIDFYLNCLLKEIKIQLEEQIVRTRKK